jgi:predicted lipoprotein
MVHLRALVVLGASIIALAGCGGSGPARQDVVAEMTETAVPDRYDELSDAAAELVDDVAAMCDAPSPQHAAAVLDQVGQVRARWLRLSPFWFGPVADRRSRSVIDWPTDPDDVAALADSEQPVGATALRELAGGDQRGLGAVEHLARGALDDRRCDFAMGASELVAEEAEALAVAWAIQGPAYADDDPTSVLGDLVSETLFALAALPGADASAAHATVSGVRWALVGDDREGGLAPLLDETVVEQLVGELDAVAGRPDEESVMALERTVRTNVVSELGLAVNFSDADGDG